MGQLPLNSAVYGFLYYFFIICFVRTSGLTPDGQALLEFKNSLTDSTAILVDWQSADASPCHWQGVTCNGAGYVNGLNLPMQNLVGMMSPSLGKLQSLQVLDVSNNNLEGTIPTELGNCSSLLHLYLFNNALNGSIPMGLMKLQNLKTLDISANALSGSIPDEIGNLRNLTFLNIGSNSYMNGTIPTSMGKLLLLQGLIMSNCKFGGQVPNEVAALPSLQNLDLSYNVLLGGIPAVLFNNTNLVNITLTSNNFFENITTSLDLLSKLPSVITFDVGSNNFYGTLPSSIGNATSLEWLVLDSNSMTGNIPAELGNLQNLWYLSMHYNNFSGPIPPEIGQCIQLQSLDFRSNPNINGTFPPEIGLLSNLNWFSVGNCSLTGEVPLEVYNLTQMSWFDISQNGFVGEISTKVGNWKYLTYFSVWENSLSGSIPTSLDNCTLLTDIYLTLNSFSGELSLNFTNLHQLVNFVVDQNNFTGSVPSTLDSCSNLQVLVLSANGFEGNLSGKFDNLYALQDIRFLDNNFTGQPFPSRLADFQNLTSIDVARSGLSGPLPSNLGVQSKLQNFRVGNNSLNGSLPSGLCDGNALTYVSVMNNEFAGPIPVSLDACHTLSTFRASYNQFTSISPMFGKDSALEVLDLSSNQLNSSIPTGLFMNNSLQTLLLGDNQFIGNISAFAFAGLPNLQRLNLSMNNISGSIPDSISMCSNLSDYLDLSFNSLTGSVSHLKGLQSLQTLHIQGNTFLNKDMVSLFEMPNLVSLNLALNDWMTSIPYQVGNSGDLVFLNMSFGGLQGSIPSEFSKLQKVEVLDLSHNNLSGSIPVILGDMVSLTSVNLSYNNLTGALPSTWVKFWRASPESFVGNPNLCTVYSANDECIYISTTGTSSTRDHKKLVTMGVVIGVCGLAILTGFGIFLWKFIFSKKFVHVKAIEKCPINFISFTGNPILFDDVMAATGNMSVNSVLKKGAYGTVYRGIAEPGISFVLKVFKNLKDNSQINRSFLNEIAILGNVKHRNIANLLGYCEFNNTGFIMYEYISNGDLFDMLHHSKLSSTLDWPTMLQICLGTIHGLTYLHHFHDPPIVHRDIKPSNILLDNDFEPYVTDFGVAKELCIKQVEQPEDSATSFVGTYGYIAPEYGSGAKITAKVDIYAFGILVLELVTRKSPILTLDPCAEKSPIDNVAGKVFHIVDYVRMKLQMPGGFLNDIVDSQLLNFCSEDQKLEIRSVLDVALLCAQTNPVDRPSALQVEKLLNQIVADKGSLPSKKKQSSIVGLCVDRQ